MNRTDWRFKFIYAIGIFFVVTGHCSYGGIPILKEWLPYYSFHLTLFIFTSGYFFDTDTRDSTWRYIWKKIRSLIIPTYIYHLIYGLIVTTSKNIGFSIGSSINVKNLLLDPFLTGHKFAYNLGAWFVAPLFMTQIFHYFIRKIFNKYKVIINEWLYFVCVILIGLLGAWIAKCGFNFGGGLVLTRFLVFAPFFSMGILYKSKLEKNDEVPNIWYFGVIFIVLLIVITYYGEVPRYSLCWDKWFSLEPNIVMIYITGFIGIAFWLRIARILLPIISENKYIALIADNSFSIMVNQFAGFMLVKGIFAWISVYTQYCKDFDMEKFKSDIWYYYLPKGLDQWLIVYSIAGIVIPILIQMCIKKSKEKVEIIISKHLR